MIKLFICDMDGTFTDGGMYFNDEGKFLKRYDTKDAVAICYLHHKLNVECLFLSGEENINKTIASSLDIPFLVSHNKLTTLLPIIQEKNLNRDEVAFIGDDINDAGILNELIYTACPCDASKQIIELDPLYLCNKKGGYGAVREFVEYLFPNFPSLTE